MGSGPGAVLIDWREVDRLPAGDGVEIQYGPGQRRYTTLAFIVGFDWKRGAAHAEVQVLRGTAAEWAHV